MEVRGINIPQPDNGAPSDMVRSRTRGCPCGFAIKKGPLRVANTAAPLYDPSNIGDRRLAPVSLPDEADLAVRQITSSGVMRFFVTIDTMLA
jgi:hypothetical protein